MHSVGEARAVLPCGCRDHLWVARSESEWSGTGNRKNQLSGNVFAGGVSGNSISIQSIIATTSDTAAFYAAAVAHQGRSGVLETCAEMMLPSPDVEEPTAKAKTE